MAPILRAKQSVVLALMLCMGLSAAAAAQFRFFDLADSDRDGIPNECDTCPSVIYTPGFDWRLCPPIDLNPANNTRPECKAREHIAKFLVNEPNFVSHIAFSIVKNRQVHFADGFEYIGRGRFVHDPQGIHRLYRIGSTSKSVTAVAAKVLDEQRVLSLGDYVSDDDASQKLSGGKRTLRHLLTHQGAFRTDNGHIYMFCYPGNLAQFWSEPDDKISPHYGSANYGNLGGGYGYSAFNYSLAGAYLANRTGQSFAQVLQTRVFDPAGMCTATVNGGRAVATPIRHVGYSQTSAMHTGPYINLVSPNDPKCKDNFYSSNDIYGQSQYWWQKYELDEAAAEARDPAGGVMASAVDMAHFAKTLLDSYHGQSGILSPQGIRDLWKSTQDLGCGTSCPWQRYYAVGFFTDTASGPVNEVEHGGVRAGFSSVFVIRPEKKLAISILANGNVTSLVALDQLAKTILNGF